jgi:nucleolar pre-ribosomal-associated protein 1
MLQHSSALEELIATAVNTYLPVAHCGRLSDRPIPEISSLEFSATLVETRWNHHLDRLPEELHVHTFLVQKPWTDLTTRIVSDLLYQQPSSRVAYLHWLGANHQTLVTTHDLMLSLNAYLDAAIQQEDMMGDAEKEILVSQFLGLLSNNWTESSHDARSKYVTCLFLIITRLGSKSSDLLSVLLSHIQSISNDHIDPEYLDLGRRLRKHFHHEAEEVVTYVVDRSLQRVVRIFSSDIEELEDELKFTDKLCASVTC